MVVIQGEHYHTTCATPIEREWKDIQKTLPFSYLVSLTLRPLLTVTGALYSFPCCQSPEAQKDT